MPARKDITGQAFGELTAVRFDHYDRFRHAHWLFRCSCGTEKVLDSCNVLSGRINSCGHKKAGRPATDWTGFVINGMLVLARIPERDDRGRVCWDCEKDGKLFTLPSEEIARRYRQAAARPEKRPLAANNTSGHTGVSYEKRSGKWRAYIICKGKFHDLGSYENKQDAVAARENWEMRSATGSPKKPADRAADTHKDGD